MAEQLKVTLPEALMQTIKAVCASDMKASDKYVAIILICHGYGLWEQQETFDPMSYAIPEVQWEVICELMMNLTDSDSVTKVNLGIDWMNQGPSGYKE